MSQLTGYINSITELYNKLDDLLFKTPDIQYNNKAIQHILLELETIKRKLATLGADTEDIRLLDNKEYPLIQDKNFTLSSLTAQYEGIYDLKQIANKLYKQYSSNSQSSNNIDSPIDQIIQSSVFKLTPMQKLLRNMMSVDTPYRGLLVVHGTGVGKTCTAVTIAENLKSFVQHNKQKIYVLRDREFRQQIFDINTVSKGQPGFQCTGETYLNELRKSNPGATDLIIDCSQGQKQSCAKVEKLVNKEVDKYYSFSSPEIWAKQINRVLETKTKSIADPVAKQKKQIDLIRTMFNNCILIIDEAHNLRNIAGGIKTDEGDTPVKFVISVLMKVLLYSQNMRLILLTATPMYDQPTDIIPLLNFLLTNDKRPSIQEKDIFDTDNNIKDKAKLLDITRGYISYVRGNDPMDFPIRLDASVNLDANELIDLKAYPTKDIYGKSLDPDNKIKHMCLVSCPMSPDHQAVLLSQINIKPADMTRTESPTSSKNITNSGEPEDLGDDELITDDLDKQFTVAYNTELQMSNYIYRTLDESNGVTDMCYGKRGLSSIARRTPVKGINYTFKDEEYAHRFIGDGLRKHGPKLAACIDNILNSTGPVFIYTRFTPGGVIPLAFALEMIGFTRYNKEPELLTSKYKSTDQTRGEYVIFTGDPLLSRGSSHYFKLGKKMVENTNVRVVIASEKGSEGLNLYGFREVHIIDPWHNINLIEQTIGRVIRYKSHNHIANPALRNVTVYMYATVLTGRYKDRESLDLHTYSIAENKAFKSGQVEYVLKTNAVDCNMMMALNYRPRELYEKPVMLITSTGKIIPYHLYDMPYSKDALYMKDSAYKCAIKELPPSKLPDLSIKLDKKRYDIEIREIIGSITAILRETFNILEADLLTVIESSVPNIKDKDSSIIQELYKYVLEYFEVSDIVLLDKYGRSCRVIVVPVNKVKKQSASTTSILRLIPLGYFDTAQPVTTQELAYLRAKDYGKQLTKEKRHIADVSLLPLITALRKDKQKLVNKEELNYNDIISKFADHINRIVSGVTKSHGEEPDADLQQHYLFETNMKITPSHGLQELYKTIFDRLLYVEKLFIIQNLVYKIKIKTKTNQLNEVELMILSVIGFIFVHQYEIFKPHGTSISTDELYKTNYIANPDKLYGFIIAEFNKLTLYKWQDDVKSPGEDVGIKGYFVEDKQKLSTLVNKRRALLESVTVNKLFGFLTYTKNTTLPPIFKITDYLSRGIKKSVKGVACSSKQVNDIYNYIKQLDSGHKLIEYKESKNKKLACSDLELVFRQKNNMNTVAPWSSGYTYYFLSPEEYYVWQMI